MGKPFRVDKPAAIPASDKGPSAQPTGGKAVVHSQRTGDPLPDASKDTPAHSPTIPWPAAVEGHKPMKLK